MTSAAGRRFDPDALAALESERDFLLRSIDDLEAERAAGNLEPDRYERLRDDYTARAAAVLRSIEQGVDARPAPPPVSLRRRLLVATGVAAFAAVAAAVLVGAVGERLPGGTATGNQQSAAPDTAAQRAELERQVRQRPDDARAHLAFARFLLDTGEVGEAVKEFDTAARLDPANAEAMAYAGWLVFLAGRSADPAAAAELTDGALRRLDAAVAAQPEYPDARFFRGMVLFQGKGDAAGAVPELERYLALVPDGPQRAQVQALLDAARRQSG